MYEGNLSLGRGRGLASGAKCLKDLHMEMGERISNGVGYTRDMLG